ncbi:DNA ligase 1-like isoform X2 [Mangifera indica]|uniref:DNA ligase 1-like isoform X2 n=1 Tax=Mangifera indica TaxID=29780 RepID=UPI001CFA0959|nr:DNA ligase 1-like isoform X2 [Mangifera indica]XP_044493052.1 DNA ligase 1-like isoform X2 [Mangifera indica]
MCFLNRDKEKKCKKDKDKEKREGKVKRNKEKEISKEKHSDKKDRKEKHKYKKDRDKDKDKNRISDAERVEGPQECCNGGKISPNRLQNKGINDSKYVQDLAERIRDEDKAAGSQIVQNITVTDRRRAELPGRILECSTAKLEEKEKEKGKNKKEVDKKINGQRNHVEARGFGNSIVSGFSGTDQKRFQGITKPVEKYDVEKQLEEIEKDKCKETDKKGDKQRDRDREKKSRSKDKSRDKEKIWEERAREIVQPSKDQLKLKDSPKGKGLLNSSNIRPTDVSKTGNNKPPGQGSLGKRKELEINGISHDYGIWPNKLPIPVSSSHLVTKNGRKMEPCQTLIHFVTEFQGADCNHKVHSKEHTINGLSKVPQQILCSTKPSPTIDQGSENCKASAKPPHPDSKYLNQILSTVPKVENWSDFDDDEWLFRSNSLQSKKAKVGSPGGDVTLQVWAEALPIESAGVTGLPYVIPF